MTRTGQGLSYLGGLGIKKPQSAWGTADAVDTYGQYLNDSMDSDPQYKDNESIFGDAEQIGSIPTIEKVSGGIEMYPFGGALFGHLLAATCRTSSDAALPYSVTGTPTVSAQTGGTLPDGIYHCAVQKFIRETKTGLVFATNVSPSSGTVTCGTGSNKIRVTWVNPSGSALTNNFPGFTELGTGVLRTAAGGSAGTEKYCTVAAATATTIDIDGSETLASVGAGAAVYWHTAGTNSTVQPPLLTVEVIRDFVSEVYDSCMIGGLQSNWKPTDIPTAKFEMMARHAATADPSTPSYDTTLQPMVGSTFLGYLATQGGGLAHAALLEDVSFQYSNNVESVSRGNGDNTIGELVAGKATLKGSLNFSLKTDDQLLNFRNGQAMHLYACIKAPVISGGTTTPASTWTFTLSATTYTVRSFPYMLALDCPNVTYVQSKQPTNTKNRIVQAVNWVANKDATAGYQAQFRWSDLTSTH